MFGRHFNIFILSEDGAILGKVGCGAVDPYDKKFLYHPELKGIVAVAGLPDGKLVVGGSFNGLDGDRTIRNIGRLNADATIDKGFSPPYLEYITSIVPQEDGKIVVGGYFTEVGHYKDKYLVRLNQDGSLDETHTWNPTPDYPITMMISKQDGTIVVLQQSWPMKCSISSLHPYNLRTLSSFVFKINGPDSIATLAAREDGRILIGGTITRFEGQKCSNILRLNPDGTLDTSSA